MRTASSAFPRVAAVLITAALPALALAQTNTASPAAGKLDPLASEQAARAIGWSRVIVRSAGRADLTRAETEVRRAGGTLGRALTGINGRVAIVPNAALKTLAGHSAVEQIAVDRLVVGTMEHTGATIGAAAVREELGYDGSGVGVAVIDSGVTSWHDDLSVNGSGAQRVHGFVDFANGAQAPYDDYGHGTHVAGIIAGNGFDSNGARTGIAPGAHLLVLKVLDESGLGRVSDVIAALDYVVAHKDALNIRVVNLSVGAAAVESYESDPLTLAARRAVAAGIVVIASAGNGGRNAHGGRQFGAVTAPGNAPWVLTVGASSHNGTAARDDDAAAAFSSHGPTAVDFTAKPDLLAPGVGIESLSDANSRMYATRPAALLAGTVATSYLPYLSLSGTSMAAPVVAGTVALMLQANPALTPNAVKAILEYTAEPYAGYDALTQGAGFLDAAGAIALARSFADPAGVEPSSSTWSRHIIWANKRIGGGQLSPTANAWATNVMWNDATTPAGEALEWGLAAGSAPNVVWGVRCGGDDCEEAWRLETAATEVLGTTVVSGTGEGDTVVWGTDDGDTVVWGTDDGDTVVWGTDTVVWGTEDLDTVVWGTGNGNSANQP